MVGIREMRGATTGKAALVVLIPFASILLVAVVVLAAAGIAFYSQGRRYGGRLPHPHIRPKRNAFLSFASPPRWAGSRRSSWRWSSGYALVPCSRDCVQEGVFYEVSRK